MNDQSGGLDNELAAFTDRVLRGEEVTGEENLGDLGPVVKRLHRSLKVERRPDEGAVRSRIRQTLSQEWERQQPSPGRRAVPWRFSRPMRLVAAAALLLVVMVGIVLVAGESEEGGGLQGTATGSGSDLLPVALVALCVAIAAFWFWGRRRG